MAVSAPLLPYFPASNVPMYNQCERNEFINHAAYSQTTEIADYTNFADGDQYQPRQVLPVDINSLTSRMKTRKGSRMRIIYNKQQLKLLENMFATTQFPNIIEREELADEIGVQQERIQTWFKNRRARKTKVVKRKRGSDENTSATSVSKKSRTNDVENGFRSHLSSMQRLALLGRTGVTVSSSRHHVEDTDTSAENPIAIYLPETSRPSPYCMYYSSETNNDSKKTVGTTSPSSPFDDYADTFSDISTVSIPATPDLQSITNHSYFDDRRSDTCTSFAWNAIDDHGPTAIPSFCPFTTPNTQMPEDYWQDFYRDSVNLYEQYYPYTIPSFQSTFEPILGTSPFSVQDTRTPDQCFNNYQASFLFATPYNNSIHP